MEINVKTTCSPKAIQAFSRSSLFRLMKPITEFILTVSILLLGALLSVVNMIQEPQSTFHKVLLIACIVAFVLEIYLFFIYGKLMYKSFCRLGLPVASITFTDESIKMVAKNNRGDLHEENDYKYNVFAKAVETDEYIFLYLTSRSAFLIDKSTIENGGIEEIRSKLQSYLDKKYKIRHM